MNTVILVLAFVAIAFLVYKMWKPLLTPPKSVVPKNEARMYFFYTDWCGFSKKAMPEWAKLETYPGRLRDGQGQVLAIWNQLVSDHHD
jgi:hypothetical protein